MLKEQAKVMGRVAREAYLKKNFSVALGFTKLFLLAFVLSQFWHGEVSLRQILRKIGCNGVGLTQTAWHLMAIRLWNGMKAKTLNGKSKSQVKVMRLLLSGILPR